MRRRRRRRRRANVVAPTPSTAVGDVSSLPAPLEDDPPLVMPGPQIVYDASGIPRSVGAANAAMRFLTAKRAKELEREAKAQEFVDGQHPNYIDGVWHCSNCGCPESIAVGRRKGPLGDKSQCGTCGKFWHRHRRPRPVEYNPDPAWHSGAAARRAREEVESKTPAGKKKGRVGVVAKEHNKDGGARDSDGEGPSTPGRKTASGSARHSPAVTPAAMAKRTPSHLGRNVQGDDEDEAMSPVSSASSESEAPLAATASKLAVPPPSSPVLSKLNGANAKKDRDEERRRQREAEERAREREEREKESAVKKEEPSEQQPQQQSTRKPVSSRPAGSTPGQKVWPPEWLTTAMQAMQKKYPHDKFDVILRKTASSTPEWRIKCLDRPGKLYTPGPNETLTNYEVHLKNRLHRSKVNDRINGRAPAPSSGSSAPVSSS
ncbi:hypothetical protein NMY22_g6930 [Coprinellus aureogranulatus]|nr:hypothetical protein NMY22_g6930 [Coprinellus aureogranulatus]